MITSRRRLRAVTALLGLSAAVLPAAAATAAASPVPAHVVARPALRDLPEPPPANVARTELAQLHVEAPRPMTGYSRAKFPHWITQHGQCDTREVVLARDGKNVKQDEKCHAVAGTWVSPYDDKTFTVAGQLDIDHVVPLANAWRSGADEWTTPQRKAFANDLVHSQLVAVSAASNRSKGDQSPDQWAPPLRSYWCTYARAWTDVKHVYRLTVTEAEKNKLAGMLDTCTR
ncbi:MULTISPECIES: HNH endonuclease family protein [unclassified Streptomyces]|uniref:HNH endonuclease family protein n=1 Tax=unclassified Streptomyces TaxID=2593676 RepID=UPI00225B0335|nr:MULTISPECIES: HNH endonuclease family protein [unclassified Streptomyces]MCX4554326.1 HNH endonuclease family protein [Streptomyces sp. NBC_01500]WSC25095.1 HNH endonuclease family protein [Streptomyces sp. NBC_01766]